MTNDLNAMSRKDLMAHQANVAKALATVADRERKAALDAVERVAADHGFTLAELTGAAIKGRKPKGAAKYRNPADQSQTWSGKGRRPAWINAGAAEGRPMSDFEI